MKLKEQPHIRWMIHKDMDQVNAIEARSFRESWTEEDFLCCLRQRNCIGMVVDANPCGDRDILGYMIYELLPHKLRILNFAVHPDHWREGVGRAMVEKLLSKLTTHRRTRLELTVRETNLPAQLFFRAVGFKARRVLRGHYEDTSEDGYLMDWRLENAVDDEVCVRGGLG